MSNKLFLPAPTWLQSPPMRRWLAIFLLVFMPFQQGWAAVTVYCQHESGAAANHFGHHEHQHRADAVDDGDNGAAFKGPHADCGICHAASVSALLNDLDLTFADLGAQAVTAGSAMPLPELSSEPERPKWPRSA